MKHKQTYTILYEDEHLAAVNKSSGIAVNGDRWDEDRERLDKFLEAHYGSKVFIVHRIDRDTSGLVVFAKTEAAHRLLSGAFESRAVQKTYIAVVHGRPVWAETTCDLPLVPDGDKLHRTIVDKYRGKKSLTGFRLLGSAGNYSVVEALPATGRTHQIRVHLTSLGHPIVCDALYGARSSPKPVYLSSFKKGWRGDSLEEKPLLDRLGLHAARLVLPPYRPEALADTGQTVEGLTLSAPLPRDMAALIKQLEKAAGKAFSGLDSGKDLC
jgi:23S rRNA pseudouridine1911/1915/1917 synthase